MKNYLLLAIGLAAAVLLFFQPEQMSIQTAAIKIEKKILEDRSTLQSFVTDKKLLDNFLTGKISVEELQQIRSTGLRLYAYSNDSLTFWSENKSLLLSKPSEIESQVSVQKLQNGWYLAHKQKINAEKTLVALRLIQHTFAATGNFLRNELDLGIPLPKRYAFAERSETVSAITPIHFDGKPLFFIADKGIQQSNAENPFAMALWLILVTTIALQLNRFAVYIHGKHGFAKSFLFLVVASLVLLAAITLVKSLFNASAHPLFNPVYCASNYLFFSLSDLLMCTLLVAWWLLFAARFGNFDYPIAKARWKRNLHQTLLVANVFGCSLLILFVVKTLVIDSLISLQVFNLLSLNFYSFIGMMCIAFMVLSHYLISFRVIKLIYGISLSTSSFLVNGLVQAALLVIVFWNSEYAEAAIATTLWTLVWMLILLWVYQDRFTLSRTRNLVIITALYAALCAYLLENLYEKRERNLRKLAAQTLLQERDFLTESNFEKTAEAIRSDSFFVANATVNMLNDELVRERLNALYLNKFLTKYDFHLSIIGNAITAEQIAEIEYFKNRAAGAVNPSSVLKLSEDSTGIFTYIAQIDLGKNTTLLLELIPRIYASGNLYSELTADNSLANRVDEEGFSYAIYRNKKLVAQRGEYAYSYYWNNEYEFNGENEMFIDIPGWEHNIHEAENGKRVIVTVKQESLFEPIAAFSYLFTFFFLLSGGMLMFMQVRKKILRNENLLSGFYTSFRTRINYSLLAIIFTSFIVIGIITISFFRQQYNQFYSDRLVAKEKSVITALEYALKALQTKDFNAQQRLDELGKELPKLSLINGIDINLFGSNGNLISTSQAPLFDRGIISRKMNPVAFLSLIQNNESQFSQSEKIGALEYRATYFPIKDNLQKTLGFVAIPYYERNQKIDDEVNNFLIALMNVYVFLLISAAALAYFISNSVTKPLAFIADKLQVVNLGRKNEPIEWNSNDEIGILVKQYNRMIRELENSAEQLARTERETAWREMAKQIAHEIKNPLTPMKLSIQYLQRAIQENNPNVNELAAKVTKTLVEQIDNLTAIATSFSSFAKMPKGENEPVDLVEMLRGITDLFSAEQEANIHFESALEQAMIFADRNQMLSVFNNLVKNGIQAVPDDLIPDVKVFISEEHNMIKVEVRDNGEGIAEENYSKVFAPNFTTKSSGTGLGLAITLQIIEGIGGAIWFESVVGEGTSFFVVIPKLENE